MYATIEQADTYISNYYGSADLLRIKWQALVSADKQVLLNRAEQQIDLLPLMGKPLESGKAFPREPFEDVAMDCAKKATIELALHKLDEEANERYSLQAQGVRSYRIGDLSEQFISYGNGVDKQALSIVFPYLQNWLGGGYKICPTRTRR